MSFLLGSLFAQLRCTAGKWYMYTFALLLIVNFASWCSCRPDSLGGVQATSLSGLLKLASKVAT